MADVSSLDMFRTLGLLTPYAVPRRRKIRLGSVFDGGYVMLDRFSELGKVYSFGVGQNVEWDLTFAQRGHQVFLFDHTIPDLPVGHDNFVFCREGIVATSDPDSNLYSLEDHLTRRSHADTNMILKLDVEGWEWESLLHTPAEILLQFEQIIIEAHDLRMLGHADFRHRFRTVLQKLNDCFVLHHVHANNFCDLHVLSGFPVPDVLELSYVRRESDWEAYARSTEIFPTLIDSPCNPLNRDLALWFFPFLPADFMPEAAIRELSVQADRLDRQRGEFKAHFGK